ncbi:uncharacterized protein DEA37_0013791 [Paragonimus westermani]|uniref:Kinesin motor domain-containing protein n=1 Tax=Paragonimus westermani TaxID=34504 RepID=A0A5J4NYG5_9TREM|nr:uncharacterized protein DEA37_0013791 [Paragonimus westermani]
MHMFRTTKLKRTLKGSDPPPPASHLDSHLSNQVVPSPNGKVRPITVAGSTTPSERSEEQPGQVGSQTETTTSSPLSKSQSSSPSPQTTSRWTDLNPKQFNQQFQTELCSNEHLCRLLKSDQVVPNECPVDILDVYNLSFMLEDLSMTEEHSEKLTVARTLQAELAQINQQTAELTCELDRLRHQRKTLEFELAAQEQKNQRLAEENTECLVRVSQNRFLQETIERLKQQLAIMTEQAEASRTARRQVRAECVRAELERQRLFDECLRLETNRENRQNQLQLMNRRRQELELYQEDMVQRQQWVTRWHEVAGAVRVFVRVRTCTQRQMDSPINARRFPYKSGCLIVPTEEKIGIIPYRGCGNVLSGGKNGGGSLNSRGSGDSAQGTPAAAEAAPCTYRFSQIILPATSQCMVYQSVADQIRRVLEGYNLTILLHGTHASGKTYTCCGNLTEPGLASFAVADLLQTVVDKSLTNTHLYVSMIEIYNENVSCLLSKRSVQLKDTGSVVLVKNQKEVPIRNEGEFNRLLNHVCGERKSQLIGRDHHSSRSHLIILVKIVVMSVNGTQPVHTGTLILCDLAYPVPIHRADRLCKDRLFKQESWNIQKSTILLSNVLHELKKPNILNNCRGTRLTELLKPCFSGDSYLILILTITDESEQAFTTKNILDLGKSAMGALLGLPKRHTEPN